MNNSRAAFGVLIAAICIVILGAGAFGHRYIFKKLQGKPYIPPSSLTVSTTTQQGQIATTSIKVLSAAKHDEGIQVQFEGGRIDVIRTPEYQRDFITSVEVVDINFDGNDDVQVSEVAGAYNAHTSFYVFSTSTNAFAEYRAFKLDDAITGFFSFDPEKRTASSFVKGRGLGDIYAQRDFAFVNNAWQLVRVETQDIIRVESEYDMESGYYVKTVREFSNDKMIRETNTYYLNTTPSEGFNLVEVPPEELPF